MRTLLLVADASRARLFERTALRGPLTEIADFANTAARLPDREFQADRPVRAPRPARDQRAGFEARTSPAELSAANFASSLCEELERERVANSLDELVVVAGPRFLGHLRREMGTNLGRLVARTVDKDLTRSDPGTIADAVAEA